MADRTLFFATDVHGSEKCFRKFVNAAKYYDADTLILGGDISGKLMIPVVKTGSGRLRANYMGHVEEVGEGDELGALVAKIQDSGYYPYVTDTDEVQELARDAALQHRVFLDLRIRTVERWVAFAEERLRGSGIRLFMMLGNDDDPELGPYLTGSDVVVESESGIRDLGDGLTLLSLGYSNRTPWNSPRELDEDELRSRIDRLAADVPAMDRCIFNLHVPPVDSGLDQAAKLDANLRPVTDLASGYVTFGAGSIASRQAIEQYQPLVGLHGHIHESGGAAKVGKTSVFNPGSEYSAGILRGLVVVVSPSKGLRNHMLTTG
jgi:Icc-related predicted phosphoesterase